MSSPELSMGIMSGTSLDGVDAALVDFADARLPLLGEAHLPFDAELRDELLTLSTAGVTGELDRAGKTGLTLARLYASAVEQALAQAHIDAAAVTGLGCHGQTVRHRPEQGYTVQLGNAALLCDLTGITVVADFRSRDIAAGGQGAPLVPAFHNAVFHSPTVDRVIVNIGGIANLTYLPRQGAVAGFDCGPGNVLMDGWTQRHLGKRYDAAGAWATTGKVQADLLAQLWREDYFHRLPPKSTGRELFDLAWLDRHASDFQPEDVQRTLLELTAKGIAESVLRYCDPAQQVFLCGGGAKNTALVNVLRLMMPDVQIGPTDDLGIAVMNVEALAFAWLARQAMRGESGNLPAVTGAQRAVVLGAIYPK